MSAFHWYAPFKGQFTPVPADPTEGPFLCVKFNRSYLPFILGTLAALLQESMWNATGSDLENMVGKIHNLLYIFGRLSTCPEPPVTVEGDLDMSSLCELLRFSDGKLQALCCGEWVDITGQAGGIGGPDQPGGGTPQPEPGACISYHAVIAANMQWYLPTTVTAGDVLTFSNPHGAAQDGSGSGIYYCPAGDIFFAGSCTGVYGTDGADPVPTEAHMGTVAQIAGVWYGTQNPITIPGGVLNAPVIFQVNDSSLGDNSGGYTFDVEVCNNASPAWEREVDFTLSPGPFSPRGTPTFTANSGHWVAGTGWVFDDVADTLGEYYRRVDINFACASCDIEHSELDMNMTAGGFNTAISFCQYAEGGINNNSASIVNGTPAQLVGNTPATGVTLLQLIGIASAQSSAGALTGSVTLKRWLARGHGTPPY